MQHEESAGCLVCFVVVLNAIYIRERFFLVRPPIPTVTYGSTLALVCSTLYKWYWPLRSAQELQTKRGSSLNEDPLFVYE